MPGTCTSSAISFLSTFIYRITYLLRHIAIGYGYSRVRRSMLPPACQVRDIASRSGPKANEILLRKGNGQTTTLLDTCLVVCRLTGRGGARRGTHRRNKGTEYSVNIDSTSSYLYPSRHHRLQRLSPASAKEPVQQRKQTPASSRQFC